MTTDETVADHEERLTALEELVGRLPTPLAEGSGLAKLFTDLGAKVEALTTKLSDTIVALESDRALRVVEEQRRADEKIKRREPWSRAGWLVLGAVICALSGAVVGGAWHWLVTLHH